MFRTRRRPGYRHKQAGEFVTVVDLEQALERIKHRLQPRDIVLLQSGADKRLGSADYFAQPGLGREGVLWLVEQGVKVIGIDAYTLDRPFAHGFLVSCLPVKIKGASAGWCRAVALVPESSPPTDTAHQLP